MKKNRLANYPHISLSVLMEIFIRPHPDRVAGRIRGNRNRQAEACVDVDGARRQFRVYVLTC